MENSTEITPEMLPFTTLSQADIDTIIAQVPGGIPNIQDIYELTPLQNGMLYRILMFQKGDPYLLVSQLSFVDQASLDRYANALQKVIERHDILRTAIFWDVLSEPAQVVLRQVPPLLTKITFNESDKPVLQQLSQKIYQRHYFLDLTEAPLLRLLAAPESGDNWVALQLMHNSIIDHLTLERLQAEIRDFINGKIDMLTTISPFRHFVTQTRLGANPAEHMQFFTQMLGDIDEPTLAFGLSDVHQDGSEINGAHLKMQQTLNDQLRTHARNLQVSVVSICHLAWAQVVSKASGREAVVFGTVLLDRLQGGEGNNIIMGPMINILPIRVNVDDNSAESSVRDTHARLSALLAHRHAPLTLAQRCSSVLMDLPLFSALLNYLQKQNIDEVNMSIPGVTFLENLRQTNYPLTILLDDDDNENSLCLSVEVVSPISAARICAYMQQTLESLVVALTHTPQQPIRELRVMPPDERVLLLHTWNQTTVHSPVCCLHHLFETQVETIEKAIAVECKGQTLTYSELNIRANRIAHYLIAQGVKPDDRIALCAERSIDMIIGILGILKAGCAYVPLDPVHTSHRLTNILVNTNPIFLLSDVTGRNVLGDNHVPVIGLDKLLPSDFPINNPNSTQIGLTPSHLAYIIYTSGSTGTPKGVMAEHQHVVRLFHAEHNKFDFNRNDICCMFHSISFCVSFWEIWNALLHGSQLLIAPYKLTYSTDEFYDWICIHGVTVLNQTPSAFKTLMWIKNGSSQIDRLRYIIVAGEALNPLIAKEWSEKYEKSGTILVNMWGSTETTIHSTFQRIQSLQDIYTIGRPLRDLSVYLLDSYGEPVLLGAEGEMYIGGFTVARGYFKHSRLTAERFLPDPFSEIFTVRMYRTGDLARYLPDGNLVFLGRVDQQIKIRGFRIEPGEIEVRLIEHSNVHAAVVQSYGNGLDTRLVAYVVADANPSLVQNLRSYLLNLLPDYMVPAAYVCLSSLPLTPSGKLDRRSLPAPDEDAFARQQYEAPHGEFEEKLARIWREILSIDCVSRHDNFFALGGHSLLVIRLLAQLRQIGLDSTVREVFAAPSLAMLASNLSRYKAVTIPPNPITKESTEITPEMLPLITLSQTEIDSIISQIPGEVANLQDIYGLTPLQSGMLFHHLMAKEGDPYLIVSQIHFIDRTSLERYTDAMHQLIERYDILRTAIFWDGLSEPAQVVLRQVPSLLTEITVDDPDKPVLEQLRQEIHLHRYRLDLRQAPLLRLVVARASKGNWVALQLMHHLVCDNVTLERLKTEIYGIMNGKVELLKVPTQFRDFVAATRLETSKITEHTRFFSEMLGDIDEPTLPFGMSDIDPDGSEMNEAHFKLSHALDAQLRAHARDLQVSLASICHLAWAQVLAKVSGRTAVVFGTVLLGRLTTGEGSSSIVGPMINTLPMRLNIDERSVESAVLDSHARLSALLSHEHAPLVLAQRCSGASMGLPLFSALMNYRHNEKTREINTSIPGVSFEDIVGQTTYPLSVSLDDDDNSLNVSVQVVSPISETRICAYMQQSIESLVDTLTCTPQHPVQKLTVIPPGERTLLLHNWNQTTLTNSSICCLHQLFEAQVECNAHTAALEYEGRTMSYTELNEQSNKLANYLIGQGVKPDDRIALCFERSISMIVGILGILKAGCAYVPLDPAYPSKRLTNILLDANPRFLLADSAGRNALENHKIPVIEWENLLPVDLPVDNPDTNQLGLNPSHLVYIIYTSGSTGTPKGVTIEHHHVVQYFEAIHSIFNFNNQFKWCQFHSISFDFCVEEIWGALSFGSQLSIVPYNIIGSADEFYDWICSNGINVLGQTPSIFKNLVRAKNIISRPDQLLYVILGGEALDPMILAEWYEKYDNGITVLFNTYGPTETTVDAIIWICDNTFSKSPMIPIGRPLNNKRVYLLDSKGEPVLLGAEGEIYIGGAGVARGYLNRPELNMEQFLSDPFDNNPAARMYRTGDWAKYLHDGNLVFLGRVDQQVKIRGFRIELGEIDSRLVEHPDVQDAVVQVYGIGSDIRLVACVVADSDTYLAQNLRAYLLNLLPEYMVPAAYVCLPSLPLTPNGKLDRRRLPTPDDKAFVRQQFEAPQGKIEKKLAKLWSELLSIDRISRHDNFFALGGHSLLIVRLLAHLRKIGLNTSVREVFDAPTLAVLASTLACYKEINIPPNLITKDSSEITPEMLPLINLSQTEIDRIIAQIHGGVVNIQDIYGLTPLQNGMLFHHLMAKDGDPYLTVRKVSFTDRNTIERYADTLQQVIERHDIFRTVFICEGLKEPAQVVLRQVPTLFSEFSSEQLEEQFNWGTYRLDLKSAPLLRLLAAPTSGGSWVAFQLMHHIIGDYTTHQRLESEINAIFNKQIDKLCIPTPFRLVVGQVRMEFRQPEYIQFFNKMLGDIEEPTTAFGLNDAHCFEPEINEAQLNISNTLNDQLRMHAQNLQVNMASLCHLAWAMVLSKASGRKTVVFGTVSQGRLQASVKNDNIAMGPTINMLPLRLDIYESSVETSVRCTHARLSALLEHEHAPLVLTQRCSGVQAGLSLINTLFNYRHSEKTEQIALSIPGVSFLGGQGRTNYPLNMSLDDIDTDLCLSVQVASPISATRICAYMQQSLESLTDALTNTPQKPTHKLTVIPPEERISLLHSWNQTTVYVSTVSCLHHLVEAQIECGKNDIAVECGEQTMSYTELNTQANQLAHYLISKGVQPDGRVAVCAERCTMMIVAMLGILKSGCAYVPLDPVYPSQRLNNILLDANPIFLLADVNGLAALDSHEVPVIDLEKSLPTNLPSDNPSVKKLGLDRANLAYIIYTSGSTGIPKGVMVEHQQVVRLFEVTRGDFEFNKQDKWSLSHSISFDFSVWEIWGALMYGSRLSIAAYNIIRSIDEFYDWICDSGITILNQTTLAMKSLMRAGNISSKCAPLRYIIFGGEELDPMAAKDLLKKCHKNGTVLIHIYGPTETTVFATFAQLEISENIYPIGRPLPDLCLYVLDSIGKPVLLAAEGEIHISGAGVARGYLNRPELNVERFLPDPFSVNPAARMYRTGDTARYLPNGNLIYLGRIDQQVKIRGFRIELGEIESQLNGHFQIKESVVLARNDSKGNKRLIAYIVSAPTSPVLKPLEIRQYLQSRLPDYMIPAAFVSIDKMPITQNSKLDRKALPEPTENAFLHQPYEEPLSELEIVIADIWQSLLEVDKVGRYDHFFELGGHSSLAVSAVNLINQTIDGDKVRVSDIFAAPTVMNLAQRIKSQNRSSELVDLQKTAFLPKDIQPLSVNNESGKAILLTGATGFVGRFLLRELLNTSQSKIYCIVRGRNQADSLHRLKNIMSKWCLWREEDEQRLIVLQGDIKKERLDLNEQTYNHLSKDVGIIFHLAVSMNHLESFDMAYQANILGLIELLRLTTHGTNKIMNYASTMSIFSPINQTGHRTVDETSVIGNERHFADQGYAASKWVAEEIVHLAIARGIACNIFRLGLITADSELARYDELQAFYQLFKSSIQMGMAFEDFGGDIQLTPVDFTAKALAHLGFMHNFSKNIFHLSAMDSISRCDFIEQLNAHLTRPMAVVSHRQWLQEARRRFRRGEILPITSLIQDMMMSSDKELDIFYISMKEATINIDSTKTLEKLALANITIPAASHQWYRLFVDSLTK